ncbi:MAG: hypothetical protein H6835_15915 [Planctomycetes bacterium]|nr:hypothetical protein [Planctomycetota bacterium]
MTEAPRQARHDHHRIDALIQLLLQPGSLQPVRDAARATGREEPELQNEIAVRLARCCLAGELTFEAADAAANALYSWMLDDCVERGFPEPAFSIFTAFDAGEFVRDPADGDPVERFTRPALRRILGDG